ncbi:hypothetical protein T492DRAFT_842697 [Pavlovales sp. CCMP2436]|nr:hypothetical protein T492DRAFT_842697 [Pavlovales sp. CCMP2436]
MSAIFENLSESPKIPESPKISNTLGLTKRGRSSTTRALANARAPRIHRQAPARPQPSAPAGPVFVRPANYRRMPARNPPSPPTAPAGPVWTRPANYRRMPARMEMPARVEMLGEIFLDVFNTPPPRINRGNLFTSVGPPDKNFRLPNSSAGMDRLYNQLMIQGRKIDRAFHKASPQEPLHRTWTLNTSLTDFKNRGIDVDHQGAVRYIAKADSSQWKSLDRTGPQRPPLDKGMTYDVTVETTVSTSTGLRSFGSFIRSARITVNHPSDLETPILDCRFSEEELSTNEANQQAHLASEVLKQNATGSSIAPEEADPFWNDPDSWRTVFSQADTLVTFTQVVSVNGAGGSSLAGMRIATSPEPMINCLIEIVRSRFLTRICEIEEERSLLPAGKTGRPKAGEVRDPAVRTKRRMINEHQKNIEARIKLLDEINVRVVADGGLKHGDDATRMEIVVASSAAYIQFICPLQANREVYWRVDNPRISNVRENGVSRTGITAFLVSPVHVVNMQAGNLVLTSEKVIKLNAEQMHAKREELAACGEVSLVTPSASCKSGQAIRTLNGDVFAFHSEFSEWKEQFWDKQVQFARMNTQQYSMAIISIVVSAPLLTGRARFQLYDEVESKFTIKNTRNRIVHKSIRNFNQAKAYTHAFDQINHRFMGSEGLCMGKVAESFLITSQQEMVDMLAAKGLEGLLVIDQDSVDLTGINAIAMEEHLSSFDANLDSSGLTAEKVADTIKRLYTSNVVDVEETRLPRVLTFIEARFLMACGVRFNGLVTLKYSNIPHYAKAVGLGMHVNCNNRVHITGSNHTAQQFFAMANEDPRLHKDRISIRTLGRNTIEIQHPSDKINTLAHASAYVVAGQRMQLAMQSYPHVKWA